MSPFIPNLCSPRQQRGVGLIEVMVAVLILGLGILGIAAMQATALKNNRSSAERSQAVIQSYAILEAMRANVDEARIGRYDIPMTCGLPDAGSLVNSDLRAWISSLKSTMNDSACGQITCGSLNCEITVQWDDSRAGANDAERGSTTQQFTTRTRL